MSYALGQVAPRRDQRRSVEVGAKAGADVIIAQASYDASRVLYAAAHLPKRRRRSFIRDALRRYGPGSAQKFDRELASALKRGEGSDQAVYDAIRLVSANYYAEKGVTAIRAAVAMERGVYDAGLGAEDMGKTIGCSIAGGATGILGLVASIYGGQAGGGAVGAGGTGVMTALDCNKEQRLSQERIAAAQAAAAQATADAAERTARAQESLARERTRQLLYVGGGILVLVIMGVVVVKVL